MKKNQNDPKDKKKSVRTLQDVPLFPYKQVRMESEDGKYDDIEAAQFEFVEQAGQPPQPKYKENDK